MWTAAVAYTVVWSHYLVVGYFPMARRFLTCAFAFSRSVRHSLSVWCVVAGAERGCFGFEIRQLLEELGFHDAWLFFVECAAGKLRLAEQQ